MKETGDAPMCTLTYFAYHTFLFTYLNDPLACPDTSSTD